MKIFSIVGARPQFIKLAPLSALLSEIHKEYIVHTGQHYDYAMSEQIFSDLGIRKPDIHLEVSADNASVQITEMMLKLETAMIEKKPDLVIVFGDTNSTFAGAFIAAKLAIPIVHIEAGLRSFNRNMPEEINRVITDHLSQHLFAPTASAIENLAKEGLATHSFLTGDIMADTMKKNIKVALNKSKVITELQLNKQSFNLLTLHRNYNVDNEQVLENILNQLGQTEEKIIFPVHPRTKKMLSPYFKMPENIQTVEPKGYFDFIVLEHESKKIITDSGGIQKEAYLLQKPCVTIRKETEWVETVSAGWNLLINPADTSMASKILNFKVPENQEDIFGENVADKMVDIINKIR